MTVDVTQKQGTAIADAVELTKNPALVPFRFTVELPAALRTTGLSLVLGNGRPEITEDFQGFRATSASGTLAETTLHSAQANLSVFVGKKGDDISQGGSTITVGGRPAVVTDQSIVIDLGGGYQAFVGANGPADGDILMKRADLITLAESISFAEPTDTSTWFPFAVPGR